MYFSENSEKIMKFFLDDFNSFIQKKSIFQQLIIDRTTRKLYNQLRLADIYISKLIQHNLERIIEEIDENVPTLIKSNYVPEKIVSFIQSKVLKVIKYKAKIRNRQVSIIFSLYDEDDINNISKFDIYVKWMLMWLYMVPFKTSHCGKTLTIRCYMTDYRKKLPNNQMYILKPENCNTAFTTSCITNGEIVIYRKEEWFKVFIHECFHVLGLDFSAMNCIDLNRKMHALFPIKSHFNLHDSYCEFWATVINCAFCSYNIMDDKLQINDFILYMDFCIHFEQIFSLFQMYKILRFMSVTYPNLYTKDEKGRNARKYLYKEKTNVFAYYIIKCLLIHSISDFFTWCNKNNEDIYLFTKTQSNLDSFYRFIESHKEHIVDDYDHMGQAFIKMKKDRMLSTTMRMSVCEMVIKK